MPEVPTAMRFAGSELFVTMGTRFRVVDVSTPNALIMLGTAAVANGKFDVEQGN